MGKATPISEVAWWVLGMRNVMHKGTCESGNESTTLQSISILGDMRCHTHAEPFWSLHLGASQDSSSKSVEKWKHGGNRWVQHLSLALPMLVVLELDRLWLRHLSHYDAPGKNRCKCSGIWGRAVTFQKCEVIHTCINAVLSLNLNVGKVDKRLILWTKYSPQHHSHSVSLIYWILILRPVPLLVCFSTKVSFWLDTILN